GALAGLRYQQEVEQRACQAAGETQLAPTQRVQDFLTGKVSSSLNETSYQPGLVALDLSSLLPETIAQPLKLGLQEFGKRMRGYASNEGQLIGVESRTSSPVRIPRDRESYEHVQVKRLYPCGEGAGYAGGIVSAAVDGERCAEALVDRYRR
uniref:FAD-dependent protein n=1 Tax=Siphonobacter sp. TaxID=1869184 RepID=UPI003B3A3D1E